MNTYNRMLDNANVVGLPAGTWYESKAKAVHPYRVRAVGGCGGMGCGLGAGDPYSLVPALFGLVAPAALMVIVVVAASVFGKSGE